MKAALLLDSVRALHAFADKIGLPKEELEKGETVDRLTVFDEEFPAARLTSLAIQDITNLITAFGDAIRFAIRVGEYELFTACEAHMPTDLSSLKEVQRHGVVTLELDCDKERLRLLNRWDDPGKRYRLFFHEHRFVQILSGSLAEPSQLESLLWHNNAANRVVVLLPDNPIQLVGPFLAIFGGTQLARADEIESVSEEEVQRAAWVHSACRDAIRWEQSYTSFLVPRHLRIGGDFTSDLVTTAILTHWANLSVLFTADRVRSKETRLVATYATERMRCDIELMTEIGDGGFPFRTSVGALGDVAEWAYDEKWGDDRLRMVQIGIARAMSNAEQPRKCASLVIQSPGIREELGWRWKTFISDEIERFCEDEQKLEDQVAHTVEAFDGEVADMIKSLSATVLAAVGVLIGSIIAAAFKGGFDATVFSIGTWSYVVYVAVFPGIYNMTHHALRFQTCSATFENRRKRFGRLLAPDVVENVIGGRVSLAKRRFCSWFVVTILAMLGVIFACWMADQNIPSIMQEDVPVRSSSP